MKKKAKQNLDKLFDIFCGEVVTVMLNAQSETTKQTETKIETIKGCLSTQGYLVDMCDDYLYLGLDPQFPSQAVNKDFIIHIELAETMADEIMNAEDFPKDEKGFN